MDKRISAPKLLDEGKEKQDYMSRLQRNPKEKIELLFESLVNRELPTLDKDIVLKTAKTRRNKETNELEIYNHKEIPTKATGINLLEIGPAKGGSLSFINRALKEEKVLEEIKDKVKLHTLDITSSAILGKLRAAKLALPLQATAELLPYRPESMSGINASAVLHEVYSYADGYLSLDNTVREINEVLLPDGIFTYRELSTPSESLDNIKTNHYRSPSWKAFAKFVLPHFLGKTMSCQPLPTKDNEVEYAKFEQMTDKMKSYQYNYDKINIKKGDKKIDWKSLVKEYNPTEKNHDFRFLPIDIEDSEELEVEAPIGTLRDLQRHYITLRDYLLFQGENYLGVSDLIDEKFIDQDNGIKEFDVPFTDKSAILAKKILEKKNENGDKEYVPYMKEIETKKEDGTIEKKLMEVVKFNDSREFDKMYDQAMIEFFNEVESGNEVYSTGLADWLKREGGENYIYYNIPDLLELMVRNEKNGYVLFPKKLDDIVLAPRDYYQAYLNRELGDEAEFEGKQMIRFTKMKKVDVLKSIQALHLQKDLKKILGADAEEKLKNLEEILKGEVKND